MIKIKSDDLERFAVKLSNKAKDNSKVSQAVRKSTLSIEKEAKANLTANKSVKTGNLRRSVTHKLTSLEGIVHTSNLKYARFVEEGTRSHVIKPKSKKMLYWKGASHPVKQVNHPGSRAKPYLIPAFEDEKPKFINNLKEAIKFD